VPFSINQPICVGTFLRDHSRKEVFETLFASIEKSRKVEGLRIRINSCYKKALDIIDNSFEDRRKYSKDDVTPTCNLNNSKRISAWRSTSHMHLFANCCLDCKLVLRGYEGHFMSTDKQSFVARSWAG